MHQFLRFVLLLSIATFLAGCSATPTADVKSPSTMPSVNIDDLRERVAVIGRLEQPLGKIVTIRGRAVKDGERNDYWSVNMAHNLFAVESVDGQAVHADIEIVMPRNQTFPTDGIATFVGYEDGGFINPPSEASKYDPELKWMQRNGRHFHTEFYALKVNP